MRDYPLDIRGLILRDIYPNSEYRWIAPFLLQDEIDIRSHVACENLARKYEILIEVDSLGNGRIIPRAAGIAARQGRIVLASLFMTAHLYGHRLEPELEARALSLLNDEKRKVRRLLNRNREWPQDVWNLQDTPAWIIPSFIHRFRSLVNSRAVSIISGSHLLAEGNWEWKFECKSHIPSQITAYKVPASA